MAFDLTVSDPLGFIADIKRNTQLFKWISLIFQMALSSVVSFCGVTGLALVNHSSPTIAIGYGLASVATVLSVFFGSSPLTRGMMLVKPEKLAEEQIKTNIAITTRNP